MAQRDVRGATPLPGDVIINEPQRLTNPKRVGDLVRDLNNEVPGARAAAIESLTLTLREPMHPEFREIVGYNLVDKLGDKDHAVRRAAILAVSDAGAVCAEPAARRLCQLVEKGDLSSAEEKMAILESLIRLSGLKELRPELSFELQKSICDLAKEDPNSAVRAAACRVIGYGPMDVHGGAEVVRAIKENDPVIQVREWAAAAVDEISRAGR